MAHTRLSRPTPRLPWKNMPFMVHLRPQLVQNKRIINYSGNGKTRLDNDVYFQILPITAKTIKFPIIAYSYVAPTTTHIPRYSW